MASVRYIETLLFEVKATEFGVLAVPSLAIFVAAVLAALPAVIHAIRIDPLRCCGANQKTIVNYARRRSFSSLSARNTFKSD